jgi:hypothetical protein
MDKFDIIIKEIITWNIYFKNNKDIIK